MSFSLFLPAFGMPCNRLLGGRREALGARDSGRRVFSNLCGKKVFCEPGAGSQPFLSLRLWTATPRGGQDGCTWLELGVSLPPSQLGSGTARSGRLRSPGSRGQPCLEEQSARVPRSGSCPSSGRSTSGVFSHLRSESPVGPLVTGPPEAFTLGLAHTR